MAYNTLTKAILVAGLTLGALSAVHAGKHESKPKLLMGASDSMISDTCAGCHGTNGVSQGPAAPTIAGLSQDYFVETMQGFRDAEIPSTIMARIAKGYTDAEYEQMAKYYGSKPFVKAKQSFDSKMVNKGAKLHDKYCEKCHAESGSSAEDDAGVLAGQWTPYLKWTLADFKGKDREASKKMMKKLSKMLEREGDAGVSSLLAFYASQQK